MSKNKELEKKLEKEIEKIKPEKEFEKRKELKQEIKEKPEKSEMKEFKEKLEIKERFKEFKDIERKLFDKGGKEIVEGGGIDPGIMFRAEKPEEGAAGAPKPEPELKQKEIEKIKPEKEFPDKIQKEIEKIKPEKEFEKFHKELEKIKPEKEYPEKFHIKSEFEKLSVETKLDPGTPLFKGSGSPEDRISELEDAVERLTHFIGVDLRPDLTTGALKGEPDAGRTGGEAKADDKKKPK